MRSLILILLCVAATTVPAPSQLAQNTNFRDQDANKQPSHYNVTGDVEYRFLGNDYHDTSGMGIALLSAKHGGSVAQTIGGLDASAGRWFRFSFRGLPQDNFAVADDGLYMRAEFFSDNGAKSYDSKTKRLYGLIQQDRRDMNINGDRHVGGAAVWRSYQLDFWLPFPQVDQVRLSVGFDHGAARSTTASAFFISDFSLVRIDGLALAATQPSNAENKPDGKLIPIGGRWYYLAKEGESAPPQQFDATNADRLLYHDNNWTAPFNGEMSAWLRAGDKDLDGNVVTQDRVVYDNVVIELDNTSLIVHTHGLPNHATAKFPEQGPGPHNPNYIQEQDNTYYLPLDPQVNARHISTALDNSNHALHMGPIGLAVNGVVFFNPFDAGNMDASSLMDRCCGHPNQDNLYHYHKYPICMYSPWRDEGNDHSALIGFAFDGFPVYGPYERAGVMAKDLTGDSALNPFNMHFDKDRGWHYHVTPGKFPYIIGGYWGVEDRRDQQRPHHPGGEGPPN